MHTQEIQDQIRDIIHQVTSIAPSEISDTASFRQDLDIDSLSLLEIGVDIDFAFKLNLPDERYKELDRLADAVALVEQELACLSQQAVVA